MREPITPSKSTSRRKREPRDQFVVKITRRCPSRRLSVPGPEFIATGPPWQARQLARYTGFRKAKSEQEHRQHGNRPAPTRQPA